MLKKYIFLLQGCEVASWKKNNALAPTCNIHKGRKWGKCQPQKEGKHHEQKHRGGNNGTWSIGQTMAWEMPISITQIAPMSNNHKQLVNYA